MTPLFLALLSPPAILAGADAQATAKSADPILSAVVLQGSTIASQLAAIDDPFIGRPASEAVLRELANALSAAYARSDVAIYTIGIERGADGAAQVSVVEGHLADIQFESGGSSRAAARVRRIAAPLIGDGPLSRKALQRALRLIADVPGASVVADLAAVEGKAGALVIRFRLTPRRARLTAQFDNGGTALMGRAQGQVTLSAGSILTGGDQIDIAYSRSLEGHAGGIGVAYGLPIGGRGLSLTLAGTKAQSQINAYLLRSRASTISLGMSYPLVLRERSHVIANASFDLQNSDTDFFEIPIITERSRIVRLGLGWARSSQQTSSFASLSLSHALGLPGARTTRELSDRRFTRLRVNAGHDRMIARDAAIRTRLIGQYSGDALTVAESLQLGGFDFGRGFEPGWIGGDSGVAGSVELAWMPARLQKRRQVELYGYVDGGRTISNARPLFAHARYDIASAGAGVRITDKALNADLSLNRTLADPFAAFNAGWRVSVRVGLRFP